MRAIGKTSAALVLSLFLYGNKAVQLKNDLNQRDIDGTFTAGSFEFHIKMVSDDNETED